MSMEEVTLGLGMAPPPRIAVGCAVCNNNSDLAKQSGAVQCRLLMYRECLANGYRWFAQGMPGQDASAPHVSVEPVTLGVYGCASCYYCDPLRSRGDDAVCAQGVYRDCKNNGYRWFLRRWREPMPADAVAGAPVEQGGKKFDAGKPRTDLLPVLPLLEIAKVLHFGAVKYNDWNWAKGMKWGRLSGAMLRHVFAWMAGEDKDPESGLSHLAHAGCCLLFLMHFEITSAGEDDRFKQIAGDSK